MKKSDFTAQFPVAWGASADAQYLQFPIPSQTTTLGRASLALGFPPATFVPPEFGGAYPFGADVNGGFRMCSTSAQHYESGVVPPWSAEFAQSIGGYPINACVADAGTNGVFWRSTADDNMTTPGASGAAWVNFFSGYMALSGPSQTSSSPTTFSNGVFSPYNVTDWTTNALPNAVTIATNFLSKSGNEQLSSSPTTFSNGLWSTATFNVSTMRAVGTEAGASIALQSAMRCGSNTLYVNALDIDGSATRTIFGATSITGAWNFGVRPTVVNTPVALTSDLPTALGTSIQAFQVTASNGTWINYPTQFSGTPSHISVQVAQATNCTAEFSDPNGSGFRVSLSADGNINLSILAVGPR